MSQEGDLRVWYGRFRPDASEALPLGELVRIPVESVDEGAFVLEALHAFDRNRGEGRNRGGIETYIPGEWVLSCDNDDLEAGNLSGFTKLKLSAIRGANP